MRSAFVAALAAVLLCARPAAAAPETVPDQYLVELRGGTTDGLDATAAVHDVAHALARVHGGVLVHVYGHALRGFAITLPAAQAAVLARHPLVARLTPDQYVRAAGQRPGPAWGLDRIDQRALPLDGLYRYPDGPGAATHLYVVDSGINAGHSDFAGRLGASRNFVAADRDPERIADCHGHGTHVAGIAAGARHGVASAATLHALRVLDCSGVGQGADVVAALDWAIAQGEAPAVVNMSLITARSGPYDQAVRNAVAAGITVVAGAGNNGADACSFSPAGEPAAITVGATDRADAVAGYSNRGACLDLFAPGTDIVSADYQSADGTRQFSGTSMAAPHVAGAAALHLALDPSLTPAQVRERLVGQATVGRLTGTGAHRLAALAGGIVYGESPNALLFTGHVDGGDDLPPVADFVAACDGLDCRFDAAGAGDDRGVSHYGWDFGDGTTGAGAQPTHAYLREGRFDVTLTVTDTHGQAASRTATVELTLARPAPCAACAHVRGMLAPGGTGVHPAEGFSSPGGRFRGYLRGPAGANFDLVLERQSVPGSWMVVTLAARAEGPGADEDLVHDGGAGVYRWRVTAKAGAGTYDFFFAHP